MSFKSVQVIDAVGNTQIINSLPNAGQQPMSNSLPVTIASDQSNISVTLVSSIPTGNVHIGNVSITSMPSVNVSNIPVTQNVSFSNQSVTISGQVQPTTLSPQAANLSTVYDFTKYNTIRVQVDSISGNDSLTFSSSVTSNGTTYPLQFMSISNTFGTTTSTISSNGLYVALGAGGFYTTITKTGSASSPVITISGSQ
jgi:hypothetical protein